ncbi:MAG: recombinase family protein [Oscillospiraceae bacterium]|jgi:DNA invertase Pin-like site-specific DNA recombinase|nr:recombinase family protein [Oscillospiraceae bacterium]
MTAAVPDVSVYSIAGAYTIAVYLRISKEDGKDESNSIKNQRAMIRAYIDLQSEFANARIIEYADDGESGESTNREAYQRLMRDVERGVIDCIIVKDLSRIGRNLIDTDDLLMNYLVSMNVRFIAINNGYDSFKNPLSNLELAIINLANQQYNRDLAQKSVSAKLVKQRRGEYLALAPFGYKKSGSEKNKLVPDDVAANCVRLIFSLACEGLRATEIAQMLNAQGVPSPSVYKTRNGCKNIWTQAVDPDFCFWTNLAVRKIIANEIYLGTAVSNRFKVTEPGTGKTAPRPKEEWIIYPDAHEAIVSEADFKKAQLILPKKRYGGAPGHIFGNKVKCPRCGHAMLRYTRQNPRFKCGTAKLTDHYGCREYSIFQSDIEKSVLESIKVCAQTLIDREEMKLAIIVRDKATASELEAKMRREQKTVESLEASVSKLFASFVAEKMSKDAFLSKKGTVNDMIDRKRSEIEKLTERLKALTEGRAAAEASIAELTPLLTIESLDKALVDTLIDKILVHGERDVEIVWADKFDVRTEPS